MSEIPLPPRTGARARRRSDVRAMERWRAADAELELTVAASADVPRSADRRLLLRRYLVALAAEERAARTLARALRRPVPLPDEVA